jgi:lipopolysaccharide transport system permease protein
MKAAVGTPSAGQGWGRLRRTLLYALILTRQALFEPFRGHLLGGLWIILNPLLITLVYLFLFNVVFIVRMNGVSPSQGSYTVFLLAGLIPWLTTQASLQRSPTSITANRALAEDNQIPHAALPLRDTLLSLPTWFVGFAALGIYMVLERELQWTLLLLPLLLSIQLVLTAGVALLLSAVGVFFRDAREIITSFLLVATFLLPIAYQPDSVPQVLQPLIWINPFTYMVLCYQDAVYFGSAIHAYAWIVFPVIALAALLLGRRVFARLSPYFGAFR